MSMFKIYDKRSAFWQWDVDQKLIMDDLADGCEVHFYNKAVNDGMTLITKVYTDDNGIKVCDIPNILLTVADSIKVYVYKEDEEHGSRTTHYKSLNVKTREKPGDYVYTETEL